MAFSDKFSMGKASSNKAQPSMRWILLAGAFAVVIESTPVALAPIQAWLIAAHEFFHALAGWLTGASVDFIRVDTLHGLTSTRGGWYPVISCAGYIGCGAFGAACLRWCLRESMRWFFLTFCAVLGFALAIKGSLGDGYGHAGLFIALGIDAIVAAVAWTRWAPFALALSGCLFMAMGLDDVKMLLFYGTRQTDAGLLAGWLGWEALAWPIALLYAAAMGWMWYWAARGLAREAWGRQP